MIKIISTKGCTSCMTTKKMFDRKKVSYESVSYEELTNEEQEKYKAMALSLGLGSFPFILLNDTTMITLQDALLFADLKVVKRNGQTVSFDRERIVRAISAAINEGSTGNVDLAESIADKIQGLLLNRTDVTVEEIQDLVENELMNSNHKDVARRYILYREDKAKERNKQVVAKSISTDGKLLTDEFVNKYKHKKAPFTEFGEFVYYRTYSRFLPTLQRREYWYETVRRAVEFNCSLLKTSRKEAEELYDNIFNLRQFLSGRTLWTGDTKASRLYAMSNFNCAFVIIDNFEAYEDIFYASMVGTGVGFRILYDDVEQLPKVRTDIKLINEQYNGVLASDRAEHTSVVFDDKMCTITVGDSKEGWTDALGHFLKLFYSPRYRSINTVVINYDNIRPYGEKLITFGGTASGYESMRNMINKIYTVFSKDSSSKKAKNLKPIDAMDIANIIAENVISGGVRRSAQICLCDPRDKEVIEAKSKLFIQDENGKWVVDKSISHRQMSNNSIFYRERPTREQIHWQIEQMRYNGEPAFINGAAIKARRGDGEGVNPCGEILLQNKGMCNLTTVNLMSFVKDGKLDKEGLLNAQKLSARAGYRMANIELELHEWNEVLKSDKLIGCSFTGLQDMLNATGMSEEEEIALYEDMRVAVHEAVKVYGAEVNRKIPKLMTTIKPEGSLSCLPTVSSGLHYPHSEFFIRRVRVSASDPLCLVCKELNYPMFPEVGQTEDNANTMVIEFPIKSDCQGAARTKYNVTAIEQLENYKRTMNYYTDHNTSITVSVREHEWDIVEEWMDKNWDSVVGVSFLPLDDAVYPLAPFESISEEEYLDRKSKMKAFNPQLLKKYEGDELALDIDVVDAECTSGACGIR